MQAFPLVDRPDGARLFSTLSTSITVEGFLADVHDLAARLPVTSALFNLCRNRYAFTVAFAAALVSRRTHVLCGEPSMLPELARQHPDCVAVADDEPPCAPMPTVLVRPTGLGAGGANPLVPADQLAAIVFTSGSTGVPTAHRKTWGALVARTRAAAARFNLVEAAPSSIVGTVPPGHMYGFEVTALLPLHAACSSWCGPAFFPGDVQAALAGSDAPRILVTTPLHLRALLQDMRPAPLHACISATAPLDKALAAQAESAWGAPILEIFGATECGSIASRRTTDGEDWTLYPGVTLQAEAGGLVATADGMPSVLLADELEIHDDRRFRLVGRRADMVKLGGRRASLVGLNRILTGLDGVRDGIFVVPDDLDRRSTARLLAVVVAPGRSATSILAELRDRMDPLFLPRRVVHVDALPRNALGKLPRQAILDLLARADRR
jgi:acyl-coenzyme A synthetase/AMP-(fatty) acid ligase